MDTGEFDLWHIFYKYLEQEIEQLEKYETAKEARQHMSLKPNAPEEAKESFKKWLKEEEEAEIRAKVSGTTIT